MKKQLVLVARQPRARLDGRAFLLSLLELADDVHAVPAQRVEFLAFLVQPATPHQSFHPHNAAQHLVGVRIKLGITFESERLWKSFPRSDDEVFRAKGRFAFFLQLKRGQQDFFRHCGIGKSVHASYSIGVNEKSPFPSRGCCVLRFDIMTRLASQSLATWPS